MGLRRVLVARELLARALTTGVRHDVEIVQGLPRGARLVAVERPVDHGGPEFGAVTFVFEHESWAPTPDGSVPLLEVRVKDYGGAA